MIGAEAPFFCLNMNLHKLLVVIRMNYADDISNHSTSLSNSPPVPYAAPLMNSLTLPYAAPLMNSLTLPNAAPLRIHCQSHMQLLLRIH